MKLKNNAGSDINITSLRATRGNENLTNASITPASTVGILQGNDAIVSVESKRNNCNWCDECYLFLCSCQQQLGYLCPYIKFIVCYRKSG